MEGLRKSEADLTVYVHPANADDVRRAVARQLSSLLFTYEDRFDGVLLAHEFTIGFRKEQKDKEENTGKEDSKVKEDNSGKKDNMDKQENIKGKILNGLVPYFGVPVQATLLLFSPQPNMMLEGTVEMLGKESIHAIVLGVFSAAIMSDDIHEKFKFKRDQHDGLLKCIVQQSSYIIFFMHNVTAEIQSNNTSEDFMVDTEMNCHITGSLIPPHTGSMLWLSLHDDEYASGINGDKRRSRDINIKVDQDEQEYGKVDNKGGVRNSERPHKSRKRSFEERY
ncbi:hypothetical protein EJB05_15774 [Eragrostis curvula]|uniref:DNA-directed RNA polymerase subunit n=1 Tax=Eragrostis curvula TaxID=38414 RepID=A0A5J9VEW5_9POAL|nr:hypothetical protein EJB05_15774 [Eragrostis curvula]